MSDPLQRLTGLTVRDFGTSYWGIAPLLLLAAQRPADDLSDLLSRETVDDLLSGRGLRTPFARMTLNGDVIPAHRYTRSGGPGAEIADQVASDKVLAEFSAGATIVLQGLHRNWPPIQRFADALASQLGHPVQVNAYVTPPLEAGLAPHYDVHDVFVVQFAGRKRWRIHEPVWELPLRSQPWNKRKSAVDARSAETPLIETVLECGDAMYLPRGYIHAAQSLGEISGHLTIGVHPVTRETLAEHVFGELGDDIGLRQALPAGADLFDQATMTGELTATIAELHAAIDRLDLAAVARRVERALASTVRAAPLRPLEQFAAAAALTPEVFVRLRAGTNVALRGDGAEVVVEAGDTRLRFPKSAIDAVRMAVSGEAVCAAQLPDAASAPAVELIARLLRDGIVVPA